MPKVIAVILSCVFAVPAIAQMLANPSAINDGYGITAGATFAISDTDYDFKRDVEIERTIMAAEIGAPVDDGFELFGQVGLIVDSEFENSDDEGNGIMIGGGARLALMEEDQTTISAYGMMNYTSEEFDGDDDAEAALLSSDVETTILDLHMGIAGRYQVTSKFVPYAAAELIPYSDGEIDYEIGPTTESDDFERDDLLNVKLGAEIEMQRVAIRPELIFVGENTLSVSAATVF